MAEKCITGVDEKLVCALIDKVPSEAEMATYKEMHPEFRCDYDFVVSDEHFMVYGGGVLNPIDIAPFSPADEDKFLKEHPEIVTSGPITVVDGKFYTFQLPLDEFDDE